MSSDSREIRLNHLKHGFRAVALCVAAAAAAAAAADDAVTRGRYLADLGDCAACHSAPHRPAYSGGVAFSASFGTVYSANITPDRETGIGAWTSDQFYAAMHEGIRPNGAHLYPAFPYAYFSIIDRADTDALFAYLKTLSPARVPAHPNHLGFPFNLRAVMWFWDLLFLDQRLFQADPAKSTDWNRGAYLVGGLGHCGACHTPKDQLFGDEMKRIYQGGVVDNWFAANLTPAPRDGLGAWSKADIVQFLKTGRNDFTTAAGSMQDVIALSTSRMSDVDLTAIATFLKALPPAPNPAPHPPDPVSMQAGEATFAQSCAACHEPTDAAAPPDYPKLSGDTMVVGRDATTVLRILLAGDQSATTANAKTGYSMPSFATLSDAEIANVATFVRNAWGNRGSTVTQDDVAQLRKGIAADPD
jgi:mono/diheme cytochrome c family protein